MLEINKVFLIGNLTQDPDVRSLTSGTPVAEFRLAVNRRYKDRNGEQQEDTVFIQVESWGRLAEFCGDWLKKGRRVFVEGRLRQDSWEAKDGTRRTRIKVTAARIQFADPPPSASGGAREEIDASQKAPTQSPEDQNASNSRPDQGDMEAPGTDDDLPF